MSKMKFNPGRFIPNSVRKAVGRQSLKLQKHSPKILLGVGIVGFGATVVTASMATLKVSDILEEHMEANEAAKDLFESGTEGYDQKVYNKDRFYYLSKTILSLGKLYGPSIALGAISLSCFIGSYNIMESRNVGLLAAYKTVDEAYKKYQKYVEDEFGEERAEDIRLRTEESEVKQEDGKTKKAKTVTGDSPSMYARFFDESNRNYQSEGQLNRMFLSNQQNFANDLLRARGHILLNDVYDMLGIERTSAGAVVGWVINDDGTDNFVDFGIFNSDVLEKRMFVNGEESAILLDFNVNGVVYDLI